MYRYGFLSESPEFAKACAEAGLVFVGPTIENLNMFSDKTSARTAAIAAGLFHSAFISQHAVVIVLHERTLYLWTHGGASGRCARGPWHRLELDECGRGSGVRRGSRAAGDHQGGDGRRWQGDARGAIAPPLPASPS